MGTGPLSPCSIGHRDRAGSMAGVRVGLMHGDDRPVLWVQQVAATRIAMHGKIKVRFGQGGTSSSVGMTRCRLPHATRGRCTSALENASTA
jgi:hypothetical protein